MSEEMYGWVRLFLAFGVGFMFGFITMALIIMAKESDKDYE